MTDLGCPHNSESGLYFQAGDSVLRDRASVEAGHAACPNPCSAEQGLSGTLSWYDANEVGDQISLGNKVERVSFLPDFSEWRMCVVHGEPQDHLGVGSISCIWHDQEALFCRLTPRADVPQSMLQLG